MPPLNPAGSPRGCTHRRARSSRSAGVLVGVVRQADRVGPTRSDGTAEEPADQAAPGQFVVAEHVRDDVADPPGRAEAGRVPLLGCQLLQQGQQVGALVGGVTT